MSGREISPICEGALLQIGSNYLHAVSWHAGEADDLYDSDVWKENVIGEGHSAKDFAFSICPDGVRFHKTSSLYFVVMLLWNLPPWLR